MLKNLKEFKLPEIEEQVLKFWKHNSIFEQSLAKNKGKNKFVFFEGPPTANGMPGLHHLLARSFKDIIPRFKSMQGFDVPRKAGWDTHGLPVEIQAEKELGFAGKGDIEKYGIAEFNAKCRELVWRYKKEFETTTTERLGFWLDTDRPYITYENSYIESLWWVIGKIDQRTLLYQGHKVVPWCTRCGTALSSHELAQGYKEVEDTSVYVKFKVNKGQKIGKSFIVDNKTYILSWTTTPWTLPGNAALMVGEKFEYQLLKVGDETHVVAKARASAVFPDMTGISEAGVVVGKELVGLSYEPLFAVKPLATKKSYKVYSADFVTTTDGTGVVHTAVMYGEDDYAIGVKLGLPQYHTVTEQGYFTKDVKGLEGLYAKSGKAEVLIIDQLTKKNLLLKSEKYKHDYPFCWRCQTALLYYARSSWFVGMSKLRKQLIGNNSKINWSPSHIKDGRFGEWLREVKDWNLSRERYWGTPLPVWQSADRKSQMVIGGLADIKKYAVTNGNRFFGIRHGESTHNAEKKNAGGRETARLRSELTPLGSAKVRDSVRELKKMKIDLIVASPYHRLQETAKIIAKELKVKIITDKRLGEIDCGIYNWQSMDAYHKFFTYKGEQWQRAPEGGETWADLRRRMMDAVRSLDTKYKNKNILIASHGDPLWILEGSLRGLTEDDFAQSAWYPEYAQPFELSAPVLPFDDEGRLDLHRPYIDRVVLRDPKSKKELRRVKEVIDVWFDSGAMPFAQAHYPFDQGKVASIGDINYPADYICEAIDQTRGWFYTLLAISTLLDLPPAYQNVICLGHIRDKNGQKMSKSRGNIVEPKAIMEKYGADALRWYFFTANDPGDPKDFDEQDLSKVTRRFVLILYNSFVFYNSYSHAAGELSMRPSTNVLDQWIVAALNTLVADVTTGLEKYEIGKAAALIETFADEMSRWYIRRSRDRFQSNARGDNANEDDYRQACATLRQVLTTLTTLTAPFMPFFSEAMYQSLGGKDKSVHLADWPVAPKSTAESVALLRDMALVKDLAAKALAARAEAKVKVRQPLSKLTLKDRSLQGKDELLKILLDEVNVKEVAFDPKLAAESGMALDVVMTPQLREEGVVRELTRTISGLRADAGYHMGDEVVLMLVGDEKFSDFAQRNSMQLKKAVNAKTIELKKSDKVDAQLDTKVDEIPVWIGVRRV